MKIIKETILSPGHSVRPRSMLRTANGDVVVVGSTGIGDPWPWATRIGADGKLKWEFVPGGPANPFTDVNVIGQMFFSAVELDNGTVLLCGIKKFGAGRDIILVRITSTGTPIDERVVKPINPPVSPGDPGHVACARWGSGVAVSGVVSGDPAGTGWLTKLDEKGDVLWQKFADYYANGELVQTPNNGLFTICWPHRDTSIAALDAQGNLMATHKLGNSEQHLVYPLSPQNVALAAVVEDLHRPFHTQIIQFNATLAKIERKSSIDMAVSKALELADGSIAFVGAENHGGPTASVLILKDGIVESTLLAEPLHASPWFIDAVRGANSSEVIALRSTIKSESVLSWISLTP